jgi:predicted nucleic acid-binding Zn ribbon protein
MSVLRTMSRERGLATVMFMDENKRCTQCGAANPVDSRFCAQCGAPIQHAAEDTSKESSEPLRRAQPSPKWRRYLIIAVVAVVVVAAVAAIPYIFPPPSDYSSQITTFYQGVAANVTGVSVVTPFVKTTVFGADAYVGAIEMNKTLVNITVFPRATASDALSFQKTVVYQYEVERAVGLNVTVSANGTVTWSGATSNGEGYIVYAFVDSNGPVGGPAVVVWQRPVTFSSGRVSF